MPHLLDAFLCHLWLDVFFDHRPLSLFLAAQQHEPANGHCRQQQPHVQRVFAGKTQRLRHVIGDADHIVDIDLRKAQR